ncbi:MAG: hypothetical protein ACRBBU_13490 [Pseudooceanicola sp.]
MSHAIQSGYKGLSLLFILNWDRILYVGAIAMALLFGSFLSSLMA